MSEENKKLGDEKLEHVAGGNDGQFGPIDDVHNTAYFSPHTVCNLPPGTSLVGHEDISQRRRQCNARTPFS